MPNFGHAVRFDGQPCTGQPFMGKIEIPNCDDPIFRAYCAACQIKPGALYDVDDLRVQALQRAIDDPSYDPWQDTHDDYLTRGL